jgi:hypothetical protein
MGRKGGMDGSGRMGGMGRTGGIGRMRGSDAMKPLLATMAVTAVFVGSGFSRTYTQSAMTRVPQFENDRAVSWKSVIPPHTESTLHRRYRTIVAIVGGDLTLVGADGKKTVVHYETGKAYWQAPMPAGEMHKDANETAKTIELVVIEMK